MVEALSDRANLGSSAADGSRQEISGALTALILEYAENRRGQKAAADLLKHVAKSEADLRDPNQWVEHLTFLGMLDRSVALLQDEDCPRKIGRTFCQSAPGIVKWLIASERSPAEVFKKMELFMASLSRTVLVTVESIKGNRAKILFCPVAFAQKNPLEMKMFQGILEGVPTVFGLPAASVKYEGDQKQGTMFSVRWRNTNPNLFLAPLLMGLVCGCLGVAASRLLDLSPAGLLLAGAGFSLAGMLGGVLMHVHRVHRRTVTLVEDEAHELLDGYRLVHSKISELRQAKDDLELASMSTIQALVKALEAKDAFTRGHSMRVAHYAVELGKKIGLSQEEIRDLSFACFVHDIGKIGVDDEVLKKKAMLDTHEQNHVRAHCEIGQDIVRTVTNMGRIASLVRYHHERWDGSGYPDGLAGEKIPVLSRILAIADVFDVLIAGRPYQGPMSIEEARKELAKEAGRQFDPDLVRAFLEIIDDESIESAPIGVGRRDTVLRFSKHSREEHGTRRASSKAGTE